MVLDTFLPSYIIIKKKERAYLHYVSSVNSTILDFKKYFILFGDWDFDFTNGKSFGAAGGGLNDGLHERCLLRFHLI